MPKSIEDCLSFQVLISQVLIRIFYNLEIGEYQLEYRDK